MREKKGEECINISTLKYDFVNTKDEIIFRIIISGINWTLF